MLNWGLKWTFFTPKSAPYLSLKKILLKFYCDRRMFRGGVKKLKKKV